MKRVTRHGETSQQQLINLAAVQYQGSRELALQSELGDALDTST